MRPSIFISAFVSLFAMSALTGCPSGSDDDKNKSEDSSKNERGDDDDEGDEKKKKGKKKKGKKKKGTKKKKGGDDGVETPASASAPSAAASAPKEAEQITLKGWFVPESPTKPPTVAEWQSAKEVNVYNAKALGCEPKFVREWMRVSCRTGSDSDNPIQGVTVQQPPKGPNFFDFYKDYGSYAVASVVFPIRTRTNAKIAYRWREHKSVLTVVWDPSMKNPVAHFANPTGTDPLREFFCPNCPIGTAYVGDCAERGGLRCTEGYTCQRYGVCECDKSCP